MSTENLDSAHVCDDAGDGALTEQPQVTGTKRKTQVRFNAATDIILLKEVVAANPFVNDAWGTVAEKVNQVIRGEVTARTVRERTSLLLSYFQAEDNANLRRSGTEEEYNERDILLQEIKDLKAEAAPVSVKPKKKQKEQKERDMQRAASIRQAALTGIESASEQEDDSPEKKKPKRISRQKVNMHIIEHIEEKSKRELELKREELELERQKLAFEQEKWKVEEKERKSKIEMEMKERAAILELIKSKLM